MCIIAVKVSGASHPTDEVLQQMWSRNPDGAGIAYPDVNGGISVVKGLMKFADFRAAMQPLLDLPAKDIFYMLHFRIGTHGSKDEANTHPFWVKDGKVAMAHNGILPYQKLVEYGKGRSDTSAFTEDILTKLPDGWYMERPWQHLVEEYMGGGNKVAVIEPRGVVLLNKSGWYEDKETGLIYSNMGYQVYKAPAHQAGGSQAGNFRQGRAMQTGNSPSTKPDAGSSSNTGTNQGYDHEAAKKRMETYKEARKKATDNFGKRCGSLVHRKILTIDEAKDLKHAVDRYDWLPEEGEDFLDFVLEQVETLKPTKPSVRWAMKLLSAKELAGVPDALLAFAEPKDDTDALEAATAADEAAINDYLANKETSTVTLTPVWHSNNAGIFIGRRVVIVLNNDEKRVGVCTSISDIGLSYERHDGGTGQVSWGFIADITSQLTLSLPRMKDLQNHLGCHVVVETLAKSHAFDGRLTAMDRDTFTVKSDLGISIQAKYDEVLSVTIDGDPEEQTLVGAKG
jgi:hypothetical protein